ncbi:MAG: iron hydrogenase small subunit [Desulfovibrionaceae bacterium]|nr:iron hydrogenase small subunit [Desulfovibrionaceae bacterium]
MGILATTRRTFLKGACILSGGLLLGVRLTGKAYAAIMDIKDTMKQRIANVYATDARFAKKASQDNKQVQKLYADLYKEPLSEIAHHNLHTKWYNRSAAIHTLRKEGQYPNPRFKEFQKDPYPYEM